MNQLLEEVFTGLFGRQKVVSTRVGAMMDELYAKALKLRKYKKMERYIRYQNKQKEVEARESGRKI